MKPVDIVLAADVGGTKTDIAVYSTHAGNRAPIARETFQNHRYDSLEAIAREFLDRTKLSVGAAGIDVAGPVVDGQAMVTNLPWVVREASLKDALGIEMVHLLNDLEATALAVPNLLPSELHQLNAAPPMPRGVMAVIAPGTGLGEAFLTWDGVRYRAHASEGGHTDFGPTTHQQTELLTYLLNQFEHVSYEKVCSGIGIPHLYQFLEHTGQFPELPDIAERLHAAEDPTRIIVEAAMTAQPRSERSIATLELFASILGAEASNLALKVLALGGVFVGGGIPPRILPLLDRGGFMQAFLHKGRLTPVLRDIPVHVILASAALMGAAQCALDLADRP